MNKMKFSIKSLLTIIFVLGAFYEAQAQYAYGISDIAYDNQTKTVYTLSETYLDYETALRYDPAVVSTSYVEKEKISSASDTGFKEFLAAVVMEQKVVQAPPDTEFDVVSDHYITAYFYTTNIGLCSDGNAPKVDSCWYDPIGFKAVTGARDVGGYQYKGSSSFFDSAKTYLLGTTGKGLINEPLRR